MPFPDAVKEEALTNSRRHCCICRKFSRRNVEVHHIDPESADGANTLDNAIVLCFDCHADVGHYNDKHPKGNKFRPSELRKYRDEWWKWCKENPFAPIPGDPITVSPQIISLRGGDYKQHTRLIVHNKSNQVYYQVYVILRIDLKDINLSNILIKAKLPHHSIELNLGQQKAYDDLMSIGGTDDHGNKVVLIRFSVLYPNESRTLTIINNSPQISAILPQPKATTGICGFSEEPAEVQSNDKEAQFVFSLPECLDSGLRLESMTPPRIK